MSRSRRLQGIAVPSVVAVLLLAIGPACVKRGARSMDDLDPPARPETRREPEPAPEPSAEQGAPRPLPAGGASTLESVVATRDRVTELLGLLAGRELTESQKEERDAGVSFLAQVQEALDARDAVRAGMLADKARILIESLERATRP